MSLSFIPSHDDTAKGRSCSSRSSSTVGNLLFSLFVLVFTRSLASAQLVTFNTSGNTGLETTEPSFSNATGVSSSTLFLGNGITPEANTNRFGGQSYLDSGNPNPTTLADAISDSEYFEFTITPLAGNQFTATKFTFIYGRSGTGPNSVTLQSSTDNFATNTDRGTASGLTGGADPLVSATATVIDFADFSSSSAVTFRLYAYGATTTGGNFGFDKNAASTIATNIATPNVTLNGSVEPIPEPATIFGAAALMGLIGYRERRRLSDLLQSAGKALQRG